MGEGREELELEKRIGEVGPAGSTGRRSAEAEWKCIYRLVYFCIYLLNIYRDRSRALVGVDSDSITLGLLRTPRSCCVSASRRAGGRRLARQRLIAWAWMDGPRRPARRSARGSRADRRPGPVLRLRPRGRWGACSLLLGLPGSSPTAPRYHHGLR